MIGNKIVNRIYKGGTGFDKSYKGMKCNIASTHSGVMSTIDGSNVYPVTGANVSSVVLGDFDTDKGKYYVVKTKVTRNSGDTDTFIANVIVQPDDTIEIWGGKVPSVYLFIKLLNMFFARKMVITC